MVSLEPVIVARIAENMPKGVKVFSAADLAGVREAAQHTPAVHVIYDGYRVVQADGAVAEIETSWLTVLAVRNARAQKTGSAAREDAAKLVSSLYGSLAGWLPPGGVRELELANAPRPGFDAGFLYLPLAWNTRQLLVGGVAGEEVEVPLQTVTFKGDVE